MVPSRNRLILGILSIISLIASIYFLSKFSVRLNPPAAFYINLAITIISGFNIAILFAWIASGAPGGIFITILSIATALLFGLRTGLPGYPALAVAFFLTSFAGYRCSRDKNKLDALYALKSEKLEEDINLLSNSADERKKSIGFLEEKLDRYSALKNVVESLSTVLSLDGVNKLIIQKVSETLGKAGRVLLFMVNMERQELMLSASSGDPKIKAKKGDFFDQWVLKHRRSLIIEDVAKDFRFPAEDVDESKGAFRSLIVAPMVSEDKIIGILRMDSPRECAYTQDDLRLLDIIAHLGAVSAENAMLYSRTKELAIKDGLTGLFTRRYFMERFHEEVKRSATKKGALSFLILDVDHFKDYNDRHGHMFGDLILKHLADMISSMMRDGDMVGRYGGEEITMLFCGMGKLDALAQSEKVRKALKAKPFILRRNTITITVSIGLSSYPEDAALEEELIRIADERLYKAKVQGRDRVCAA
ncbi:MAG: sensor domain-containing diguanylate cyclase [Candidatus Omnitrophota bacterium]|nr:sensor domain-containing diguanylate cyclase [Candidatus Omnitrophota bacterium]